MSTQRNIFLIFPTLFFLMGISFAQGVEYKELKKKLQYGDLTACLDAVQSAGKLNDAQAVKLLEIALENRKWEVRQSAVIALGKLKGKPAIELLFESLNDLSLNVVAETARTIAQIEDPYVMEKLKLLLKKDYVLRFNAMAILGLMKKPEGVPPLIESLKDKDPKVRRNAINALALIKDERAVIPLIKTLIDKNDDVRASAALALGWFGDRSAIEPLSAVMHDKNRLVGSNAAAALAMLGDSRAFDYLAGVLEDHDDQIRINTAEALGNISDVRAVGPLAMMIHDGNSKVRLNAAKALGKIADKRALPPLIIMIHDPDILVQLEAVKAMGNFDDDSMIDPLIEALKADWYSVRYCAAQVLQNITKRNIGIDYEKWKSWRSQVITIKY